MSPIYAEVGLAGGILAGQLSLVGFVLVFHAVILARYAQVRALNNLPRRELRRHRQLLMSNTMVTAVILAATSVPIAWLISPFYLWPLIVVFVVSAVSVVALMVVGIRLMW